MVCFDYVMNSNGFTQINPLIMTPFLYVFMKQGDVLSVKLCCTEVMRILRIMMYVQCMMYKFKTQLILDIDIYDFIRDWFIRLYLPLLHQLTIKNNNKL